MKCVPFQSPSMRKPMREFCGLKRKFERFPLTVLLYGTLPKFVPMLEPAFLSRHTVVRSMKPIGTMQTLPSRRKGGTALASGGASQGLVGFVDADVGDFCGRAAGSAAERGTIAVVLAIWPVDGKRLAGGSAAGALTG